MERKVFKYPLPLEDHARVKMPYGAKVLSVHEQNGEAYLWALIDPTEAVTTIRTFRIAGTGHSIEYTDQFRFVGSVFLDGGNLVFHVFDVQLRQP